MNVKNVFLKLHKNMILLLLLEQYLIQQNSSVWENLNRLLQIWERGFDLYFTFRNWSFAGYMQVFYNYFNLKMDCAFNKDVEVYLWLFLLT